MDARATRRTGRRVLARRAGRRRVHRDPAVDLRPGAGRRRTRGADPGRPRGGAAPAGRELAMPLSAVLLAAHVKVLAALSGETEVVDRLRPGPGGRPLPCRLATGPGSWRALLLDTHRRRVASCWPPGLPGRRAPARAGPGRPAFETVLDPTGGTTATSPRTPCCGWRSPPRRRPTASAAAVPDGRAGRRMPPGGSPATTSRRSH